MPTLEAILTAVAGKGVERGLDPERVGDTCVLRYPEELDERADNLHKQSIRSLVKRVAPDWKIHIDTLSEGNGFSVEVRPNPAIRMPKAENGAGSIPRISDASDGSKLAELSGQLQEIARELESLVS